MGERETGYIGMPLCIHCHDGQRVPPGPAEAMVLRAVEAALTVESLAQALCDSSSHMNTLPHAEQRPCHYHRNRAADTLKQLARAAAIRRRGA